MVGSVAALLLAEVLPVQLLAVVWVSAVQEVALVVVVSMVAAATLLVVVETVTVPLWPLVASLRWHLAGSVRWAATLMAGNCSKAPVMVFPTVSPLQSAGANQPDWQTESL
jgi:hypothetical protein